MLPAHVRDFRAQYRKNQIGPRYSGWAHLAFTSLGSLGMIGAALLTVKNPGAIELLTVPVTFFYANWAEYVAHRWPMHHPWPGLKLLFKRHTLEHHRFFTENAMACEATRDFKMILFPPAILLTLTGLFLFPAGLLLWHFVTPNVACLFFATALGYFLNYEWFHLSYHVDEASWVSRLPFVRRFRGQHSRHHDPARMTSRNFNISWPLFDRVYRTLD